MNDDRYRFAALYVRLARTLAWIVGAAYGILAIITLGEGGGAAGFLIVAITGAITAFVILVGADLVACFLQIERNTRRE